MAQALTLRWVLQKSGIAGISCVCGEEFLDNEIRGVQIMDNPDTIKYHKQGDIVLTTGFLLKDNPIFRKTMIAELAARKCSGILFKTNRFFEQVPSDILKDAVKYSVPILELPHTYAISEVNRMLMHEIFQQKETHSTETLRFFQEITAAFLTSDNYMDAFSLFARQFDNPVLYFSANLDFEYIGSTQEQLKSLDPDQLTSENCFFTETQKEQIRAALQTSTYTRSSVTLAHIMSSSIIWAVLANNNCIGYLCVLEQNAIGKDRIGDVEAVLPCISLALSKQLPAKPSPVNAESQFLTRLFHETYISKEEISNLCHMYHLQDNQQFACISVQLSKASCVKQSQIKAMLYEHLYFSDIHLRFLQTENTVDCLVIANPDADAPDYLMRFHEILRDVCTNNMGNDLLIGISNFHSHIHAIRLCYQEAQKSVFLGSHLPFRYPVFLYSDQQLFHTLHNLATKEDLLNIVDSALSALIAYDRTNNTDLLQTLEALTFHKWNLKSSAAALYIHRNTICYRKEQIVQILHLDLDNVHQINYISLAIYAKKILEWYYDNCFTA